ncbi:proteoglycan Cow-like isoform X2 [Panonychus citri]|uniref:proteoglycan Cow-like isoform X2 n=1 Tax=Panonychus citri TaxID=50023 RepID=UPI002307BE7D|nr:proteoglycan Cow-like isoform X2 [Panonychus citri]
MRGFIISLIVLFLGTTINLVISETSGNSKQLNSDDYDDDSEDFDDSPEDQELQLEDKRPSYLRNQGKDRVKEIYLSWDLDLCKDVQCKSNQVCMVKISRKSAVCVARKSIDKKKAQSKREFKWSTNNNSNKKLSYKVSSSSSSDATSISKSDSEVLPWDSSDYLPSPSSSPPSSSSLSSSSNNNKSWKDCRPCPVIKPSFYCGTDNSTYSSMCRLQFHNCVHHTDIEVACKGFCPCGSPVNSHVQAKEIRNHERWNKYMDTLGKLRRSHKIEKFVKSRAKVKLENDGNFDDLYHEDDGDKKLSKKRLAVCNKEELKIMGHRLSDWFVVVLRDQKRSSLNKKDTFMDFLTIPDCPNDIANMFHRLDLDGDLRLSLKELYDLEHDKREKCLKQYLDGCDEDRDTFLNPYEWCSCFDRKSKPCLIEKSQRKRLYGEYVPKCDKEGFYQSIQCHLHKCWCVDRYGVEIADTRQIGMPNCDSKDVTIKRKNEKRNSNSLGTSRLNDRKVDEFDDSDDSDDTEDDSLDGSGYEP